MAGAGGRTGGRGEKESKGRWDIGHTMLIPEIISILDTVKKSYDYNYRSLKDGNEVQQTRDFS